MWNIETQHASFLFGNRILTTPKKVNFSTTTLHANINLKISKILQVETIDV